MARRFAVISDIHSNIVALEAVLKRLEEEEPDEIYCLGDVVGYGAEPEQCVEAVRKIADGRTILGNHDLATADPPPGYLDIFNPDAREAIGYQRSALSPENLQWLASLPKNLAEEEFQFFHGSPVGTDHYLMSITDLYRALEKLDGVHFKLAFFGHTHVPTAAAIRPDGVLFTNLEYKSGGDTERILQLEPGIRYLINPGSVGQPRDRNPASAYLIVDLAEGLLHFRRVEYDITEAQGGIIAAGLPIFLAQRLEFGF
ncbi:MAG TPA: metallophosphoesterase family protein [Acidobacteriota bacterium]|nr:metallophosphoesterase family protein [Acidobacteriota bacterium]